MRIQQVYTDIQNQHKTHSIQSSTCILEWEDRRRQVGGGIFWYSFGIQYKGGKSAHVGCRARKKESKANPEVKCKLAFPIYHDVISAKKKSELRGGGPAVKPSGKSLISADRSARKQETSVSTSKNAGKRRVPSNLIFNPISVNAWTKLAVSLLDTWPPSLLSIFKPSVQSAHLL